MNTVTKILIVLQTILSRQAVLMPLVTAVLAAFYHAFKPKSESNPDFNNLANMVFIAIGTISAMLGALHDQNAKRIDNTAAQASDKLTEIATSTNAINPNDPTPIEQAKPIQTPVEIKPAQQPTQPEQPKST